MNENGHCSEKHPTTSGQVSPKSDSEKLHEKSSIPQFSERLQEHMEKSALRAEKTGAKLENARKKMHKQKSPKNPGLVKSLRHETWRYTHGKIHQVEQDNVGTEAAHRMELIGESTVQSTSRLIQQRIRTRPVRRVRKWEKYDIKAKSELQFRKLTQKYPDLKKNSISRFIQKQQLKRRYQKQARQSAKKGANATKRTVATTEKIVSSVVKSIAAKPHVLLFIGMILLLIIILQACMGMSATLGGSTSGGMGGAVESVDAIYSRFEMELQSSIDNMEITHPGYDEYRRNIGSIGHDPAELLKFLVVCNSFPENEMENVLRDVFNAQYELVLNDILETKEIENEDGETVKEEISVLEITLIVRSFAEAISSQVNPEQLEWFRQYN